MDIKRLLIAYMLLFTFLTPCMGQHKVKPLNIGDTIPDLTLTNNQGEKIKLKEYNQSDLMIIDFWATWCVPCVRELKFLDSLKSNHPGKFNFMVVSNEKKATVNNFFKREINSALRQQAPYIICEDTTLAKYFPHRGIPHNIWVDKDGVIRAITSTDEITTENILDFGSSNAASKFRVKKDKLNFRPYEVFHLGDSSFTYRSIISPYVEGIPSGQTLLEPGKMQAYLQFNESILTTLWSAYSNFNSGLRLGLIEVHTSDSSRFFSSLQLGTQFLKKHNYKSEREWKQKNLYCYALTLPEIVADSTFKSYMYDDIKRQFNITCKVELRNVKCNVVTQINPEKIVRNVNILNTKPEIRFTGDSRLIIQNCTIDEVLEFLFKEMLPRLLPDPFVNRTGVSSDLRFDAQLDFANEPGITTRGLTAEIIFNKLKNFGFKFNSSVEPYPVLVVNDHKK